MSINTWQLSKIEAATPINYIIFLLALRGLAMGLTLQTSFVSALSSVPLNVLLHPRVLECAMLASLSAPAVDAAKTQILSALKVACDQSMQGFENVYRLPFFAALGALIIGAFLPGWPGKWRGRGSMQGAATGGH